MHVLHQVRFLLNQSVILTLDNMSSEQPLSQRVSLVVNGSIPIELILEDIQNLSDSHNLPTLQSVFNQLIKGCNSKSSSVVDLTTQIIHQLVDNTQEQILAQLNAKEFQKALMYTLRGKTTRFGNKFSMHRETWRIIEDRVLGFYGKWFQLYMMQEDKAKNILSNYKTLKSYNIKFPEYQPSTNIASMSLDAGKRVGKSEGEIKLPLETEREGLETFLEEYGKMIDDGIDSSISDSIEFKIKEKLIYALNNVLLHQEAQNRFKLAIQYNKRFNELIVKLNTNRGNFKKKPTKPMQEIKQEKQEKIPKLEKQQKQQKLSNEEKEEDCNSVFSTQQGKVETKEKPEPTKVSRLRSLIRSTIAFMSSQPAEVKDEEAKEAVMMKLDETIGDLVKYFDNEEDVDVENIPTVSQSMTKSSLY